VQVQGPFEFNADASQILFASPRTGNFEIYAVTLDDAGKAALATKPEHINPDQVSQVPQASGQNALGLPTTAEPYLLAFGLLALGAVAAEGLVRRRRRAKTEGRRHGRAGARGVRGVCFFAPARRATSRASATLPPDHSSA